MLASEFLAAISKDGVDVSGVHPVRIGLASAHSTRTQSGTAVIKKAFEHSFVNYSSVPERPSWLAVPEADAKIRIRLGSSTSELLECTTQVFMDSFEVFVKHCPEFSAAIPGLPGQVMVDREDWVPEGVPGRISVEASGVFTGIYPEFREYYPASSPVSGLAPLLLSGLYSDVDDTVASWAREFIGLSKSLAATVAPADPYTSLEVGVRAGSSMGLWFPEGYRIARQTGAISSVSIYVFHDPYAAPASPAGALAVVERAIDQAEIHFDKWKPKPVFGLAIEILRQVSSQIH